MSVILNILELQSIKSMNPVSFIYMHILSYWRDSGSITAWAIIMCRMHCIGIVWCCVPSLPPTLWTQWTLGTPPASTWSQCHAGSDTIHNNNRAVSDTPPWCTSAVPVQCSFIKILYQCHITTVFIFILKIPEKHL